jgi:hypothetical protein
MTYSQIKANFKEDFQESSFFLGFLDFVTFVFACLAFIRYIVEAKLSRMKTYLLFSTISLMAFLTIPITSLILKSQFTITSHPTGNSLYRTFEDGENSILHLNPLVQHVIPALGLFLFGFGQIACWPTLLALLSQHLNAHKDGMALGFWSSNGDIGNIAGFAFAGIIIANNVTNGWEISLIISGTLCLLSIFSIYFFV